jgi:hypothetical protein
MALIPTLTVREIRHSTNTARTISNGVQVPIQPACARVETVQERPESICSRNSHGGNRHDFGRFRTVSTRAREAEWELGTLATDNIVRHSRRAEITTLHEVLWMRPRVPPTPPR